MIHTFKSMLLARPIANFLNVRFKLDSEQNFFSAKLTFDIYCIDSLVVHAENEFLSI